MKPCVFVHTNEKQWLGALVSAHSMRRGSRHADRFDVRILHTRDFEFLSKQEGRPFLREGDTRIWTMDDLQSFTPLRFLPPQLMGFAGRAMVTDPDVFAVGDVWELLSRDMAGKAVLARRRSRSEKKRRQLATSVMLLDCARLRHWRCEEQFDQLFRFERDYKDWISLLDEPEENIGLLEEAWNDFDHLSPRTKLLHNTKRRTQPWKTGLPADFRPADKLFARLRRRVFGERAFRGRYRAHPDPKQQDLFFGLLRECLENGTVTEALLREEMARDHLRHDALEVLERTPPLRS